MTAPPATDLERLAIDTIRTLVDGRGPDGELRPPGHADGDGAARVPPLPRGHEPRPEGPALARPRPVRAVGRPRLDAGCTRRCTCPATTSRWRTSSSSASGARKTPGHPEHAAAHPASRSPPGPLGQGFANGVGMAMAERFLRERYGSEVQDHRTYVICSDGDLMEGIAREAASLAGQLGLGRWSDSTTTTDLPRRPDVAELRQRGRHEALRRLRLARADVDDVNDLDALRAAIAAAQDEEERPSLIRVARRSSAWPAPNKQGTSTRTARRSARTRSAPRRSSLGWDPDGTSTCPTASTRRSAPSSAARRLHAEWAERFSLARAPSRTAPPSGTRRLVPAAAEPARDVLPDELGQGQARDRAAGGSHGDPSSRVPTMVGGAADLTESTKTTFPAAEQFTREHAGRNVFFGVREHAHGRRRQRPGRARRDRAPLRRRPSCSSPTTCAAPSASPR